jgi:hypothetical protein
MRRVVDIAGSLVPGDTLDAASACRPLGAAPANQHEVVGSTAIPAIFRLAGHSKAGVAEGQLS